MGGNRRRKQKGEQSEFDRCLAFEKGSLGVEHGKARGGTRRGFNHGLSRITRIKTGNREKPYGQSSVKSVKSAVKIRPERGRD